MPISLMPVRRYRASGRRRRVGVRRRRVLGRGFFSNLWSGVKSVANRIPWGKVNDYLKDNKVISGNIGALPGIGGVASSLAGKLGYARRKRRVGARKMTGARRRRPAAVRRTRRVGGRRYRTLMF